MVDDGYYGKGRVKRSQKLLDTVSTIHSFHLFECCLCKSVLLIFRNLAAKWWRGWLIEPAMTNILICVVRMIAKDISEDFVTRRGVDLTNNLLKEDYYYYLCF